MGRIVNIKHIVNTLNNTAHFFPNLTPYSLAAMLHDDVIKWKHFPRNWPFVRGIHRSPVNSPHKGQRRGALMFSLICVWINKWVNNREAGDSRRYRARYDVIVMIVRLVWVLLFANDLMDGIFAILEYIKTGLYCTAYIAYINPIPQCIHRGMRCLCLSYKVNQTDSIYISFYPGSICCIPRNNIFDMLKMHFFYVSFYIYVSIYRQQLSVVV